MTRTIAQFMWGFQDSFRMSLEIEIERAFAAIGLKLRPEVYLVGFLVPGGDRHPVCIEPENGPFAPDDLSDVTRRAEDIFLNDPERQIFDSNPRLQELRQLGLRDHARAQAIKGALEAKQHEDVTFFVGRSVRVEQHEVHIVVALPWAMWNEHTRLDTTIKERMHMTVSLADGVIYEVLRLASQALFGPDPGAGVDVLDTRDSEIARMAADRLVTSAVILSGELMGGRLFDALNAVSTLSYEQRTGIGSLVLARSQHPDIHQVVTLRAPIEVSEHRTIRKLLETSDRRDLSLLTNGRVVYGLGSLGESYEGDDETAFEITVMDRGTWELRHAEAPLLRVEFGSPSIPRTRIDRVRFDDIVQRVFSDAPEAEPDQLWKLTLAAADAEHGTMLVVSQSAGEEADRLSAQALPVEPVVPSEEALARLTAIDGAVLLSPDGACHAIGVILDAAAVGDRSRGARFNSAVRYLESTGVQTMIILVSEDGMIDLLPDLKPQIRRSELEASLQAVRDAAEADEFSPERFHKSIERLETLKFYLSADQCDEANASRQRFEDRRWEEIQMRFYFEDMEPNPRMDESYFLDE